MMLVPAGAPVDDVIDELFPLLEPNDLIIDGGNSHFTDTNKRLKELSGKNIHFLGVGISGGENGARFGPVLCRAELKKLMNVSDRFLKQLLLK